MEANIVAAPGFAAVQRWDEAATRLHVGIQYGHIDFRSN
jgi:hypothetical protein